jgi:L-2-hydroxyglutarate oxidase LhgO
MDRVECVVVGAGVVGLAIARALALAGREVLVLEQHEGIGTETSSRNSEVVHAGIYYPNGSLKAKLCVAGREMLYAFCAAHGVPAPRIGKIIVATDEAQIAGLEKLKRTAEGNGVDNLTWLDRTELKRLEPALNGVSGLLSPSTGIVDSHAYMVALQGDAENAGALMVFHSPVERATLAHNGDHVIEVGGAEPMKLACRMLVNSGGLHAPGLARRFAGLEPARVPPDHLAKGNYYTLSGCRAPFKRLIYPAPEAAGLGIHLTLDLAGQARFGPDVEWVTAIDYTVDPRRSDSFYAAIRTYWPDLPDGALQPGYSGMRPKLQAPGEPAKDYMIQGPRDHGVPGLVNLFGIESPGLTSSLAIAEMVADQLA